MIRRGKQEGWLRSPIERLPDWARLNNIAIDGVVCKPSPGEEFKGLALISLGDLPLGEEQVLIHVPKSILLSLENMQSHAQSDRHLKAVYDAVGKFADTPRGAIMIFLLVQMSRECPQAKAKIGVGHPIAECVHHRAQQALPPVQSVDFSNADHRYIKFLPLEPLPTFWSDTELDLFKWTTLAPAMPPKLHSLEREFDQLRDCTANIDWCRENWWAAEGGLIDLDDWKQLDAIYRSRCLEMPEIGDSMVPLVDMANHESGVGTLSRYEGDYDCNGQLLLRRDKALVRDQEVTITYGEDKGACEMIFSYGFVENGMEDAKVMFLGLDIPEDDPLRLAKLTVAECAPGVRISSLGSGTEWESAFVWIICVNEEDGLRIQVARTNDGGQELHVTWRDERIDLTKDLRRHLEAEPLWPIYQLRATVLIQGRVQRQLHGLGESRAAFDKALRDSSRTGEGPRRMATLLRRLEENLLKKTAVDLQNEINRLMGSADVQRYLEGGQEEDEDEDDFR